MYRPISYLIFRRGSEAGFLRQVCSCYLLVLSQYQFVKVGKPGTPHALKFCNPITTGSVQRRRWTSDLESFEAHGLPVRSAVGKKCDRHELFPFASGESISKTRIDQTGFEVSVDRTITMDGTRAGQLLSRTLLLFLVIDNYVAVGERDMELAPVVNTASGPVSGVRYSAGTGDVDAYLGIPFAKPPIGDLRFKKPLPVTPWNDIFRAVRMPQACVQTDFPVYAGVKVDMSDAVEDCLRVNVWVPRRDCGGGNCSEPLPVLVFLYGGHFLWGSSAFELFDGFEFASRSGMVYVTFNYRVGTLGFLNGSSPEAPGNMGLYDQVEALRWVNRNIGFFGGNPDGVTLGGHSAGAISVSYHMMSPLSKGLFKRAVLLSGNPSCLAYVNDIDRQQNFRTVKDALNCSDSSLSVDMEASKSVQCLKKLDAHELTYKAAKALKFDLFTMLPGYGDEFLPNNPISLDDATFHVDEIFLGHARDDGAFLVSQLLSVSGLSIEQLDAQTVFRLFLTNFVHVNRADTVKLTDAYFSDGDQESDAVKTLSSTMTDPFFDCGTSLLATSASERNVSVFRYMYSHRPSNSFVPEWVSGTHGEELPFFLGTLRLNTRTPTTPFSKALHSLLKDNDFTSEERQFSDELIEVLARFCKMG